MAPRPVVVVIGAGFGGVAVAKDLRKHPVDVVLIDRRNYHLFQPLLYQVATAGLNPGDIAQPIRSMLRPGRHLDVILGDVETIDLDERRVHLLDGRDIAYDYLVVAAGAHTSYFGNDDWEHHAPGLKTVEDAIEIRARVLSAFETADRSRDPDEQARSLTFVVVGAGATGVEMAGAISGIATEIIGKYFTHFDARRTRVILVEGSGAVLGTMDPKLSRSARRQLEDLGVEVLTNTYVTDVTGHDVEIEHDGLRFRIPTQTIVWAAGVGGSPLAEQLGIDLDRAGRAPVDDSLSIEGRPELFVIGDMARFEQGGEVVPGVAPAAMQGGSHVASVIAADLAGEERPAFRYVDKGTMAAIGRSKAVAQIGPIKVSGFTAWVIWWAVHIALLVGFRNRVFVMLGWGWSWLTRRRGVGLITTKWMTRFAERDTDG